MMILAKPVYIIFQILSLSQILRVFVQYQGVSPVPPFSTIVGEEDGKYIFSPGGSFVLFLEKTSSGLATARIAFGWWEEKL